jgi:hypothetical protein
MGFAVLSWGEPALHVPGEARVELDARGRLFGVAIVPPAHETTSTAPAPPPRWDRLFAATGLDAKTFRPVPVEWTPPMAVDARAAWVGQAPDLPGVPLRLEAGAWKGRPVWLRTVGPWTRPPPAEADSLTPGERIEEALAVSLAAGSLLAAVVLAYRHLRTGRGDRRGALRLAFWFFVAHTLVWAGTAEHARSAQQEWSLVQRDLGYNLFLAALLWLYYVGLEPYVRRQWPEMLISWNRLLAGRLRDPRVGRDVLIGLGAGGVTVTLDWLGEALPAWRRGEPPPPRYPLAQDFVLDALDNFVHGLLDAMLIVFILLLILAVVRRRWLAVVLGGSLFTALLVLGDESPLWSLGPSALAAAVGLAVMVRFGLVAFALMLVVGDLLVQTPWSADAGAWYAWQSWTMGALLAAMLLFGLRTVTAGRPLFAGGVLADGAR